MTFNYLIKRSKKRKTVSIVVQKGQVRVLVPDWLPESEISQLVQGKQAWILNKLNQQQAIQSNQQTFIDRSINENSTFNLFDQPLLLTINQGTKTQYQFDSDSYVLNLIVSSRVKPENQQAYLQKLIQSFYTDQLSDYLQFTLPKQAELMRLIYHHWQVKNYKAKWGACNSHGELSFNWRLAAMPLAVVDSVIIHELAHLKHLNHSAEFWRFVGDFDPEFQQHKQYLAQFSQQFSF